MSTATATPTTTQAPITAKQIIGLMFPTTLVEFINQLWGMEITPENEAALVMAAQELIALIGMDKAEEMTGKDLYQLLADAGIY